MAVRIDRWGGVVLCGGRSSRMGRPKAWLPVGDEVMLQRAVRVVGQAVGLVVVVAAPGQDVPDLPVGVELVRDEQEGLGPLAGLAAGLAVLEGRADAAFLSACDVPLLTPAFVRRVCDQLNEADACVPNIGGRLHPLAAAYRISLRPAITVILAAGERRMTTLLDAVPPRTLGPADFADIDPDLLSLRNVNTPADYAALQSLLRP